MDNVKRVFVIHSDNGLVHTFIGPTLVEVAEMIQQQDDIGKPDVGIEFFDSAGHRLVPAFGPDWTWKTLQRTADAADPALVQGRIQSWVDFVTSRLEKDPAWLHRYLLENLDLEAIEESPEQSLERVLGRLPQPGGESLAACFAKLCDSDVYIPQEDELHSADPLHNLWRLLGGTHS